MSTHDFAKLVDEVSPRLAIMTHLGMKMAVNDAKKEADSVKEQTGVNTFAAYDGMKINLDQFMPKQETLDSFR